MLNLKQYRRSRAVDVAILFGCLSLFLFANVYAQGDTVEPNNELENYVDVYGRTPEVVCELPYDPISLLEFEANSHQSSFRIAPQELAALPKTANIQVNYTGSWTTEAQNAFEYAITIWESQISSPVTIIVDAEFSNLGQGVLGAAGPSNYYRNFSNAPQSSTWYPVALANSLAGTDLDPSRSDISSRFNSGFDWYYGTDANPPFSQVDFVSVVLHEIGHGLGMSGSFQANNSIAAWGSGTSDPDIYDRFVENGSGVQLISGFANFSASLRSQLTSNSVYFDGAQTRANNNGDTARLYAPTNWSSGSSIAHVDNIYNGTENALMTFSLSNGVAEHTPGPIFLGILADMGWNVSSNEPPSFATAGHILEAGTSTTNAIDLWAQTSDNDADSQLTFAISNNTSSTISVSLVSNRYLNVTSSGTGSLAVTVTITDTDGAQATGTVNIYAVNSVNKVNLPLIER